jgi:hypothetical protein
MTWVRPPGSKSSKQLAHTLELEVDFRRWLEKDCTHQDIKILRLLQKDGREVYRRQCPNCGLPDSTAIKRALIENIENVPDGELNRHMEYEEERRAEWAAIALKHYRVQNREDKLAYDQYLNSPKWRAKSQKVIKRAGGICEGCLERPATQAHHISYRHIYQEFLWELRAVCEPCHHRAHADDGKVLFGDDGSIWEQPDDELDDEEYLE